MTSYVNRRLGLGVAPGSYQLNAIGNILFSGAGAAAITAKVLISGTVIGSGSTYGLNISSSFDASTTTNYGIYSKPTFTGTSAIANAYNLYVDNSTKAAGSITAATGIYLAQPTSATTNKAMYIAGQTVGANDINFQIDTTFAPTATAILYGAKISPSLAYSSGASTTSTFYTSAVVPSINVTSASQSTYSNFYTCYINPTSVTMSGTNHIITNFYGIYSASPAPTLANSSAITNAYSGYFAAPGLGTNKVALWTADITIDAATAFAPLATDTNKNVVSLTTGISNAGYVLTSTGAGSVPTWQATTGGVTSITGTANQITASSPTGAITLSLPSTLIAPGTLQVTSYASIGTAVNSLYGLYNNFSNVSVATLQYAGYYSDGTFTLATNVTNALLRGLSVTNTFITNSATSILTLAANIYSRPTFTNTTATSFASAASLYLAAPIMSGSIGTAYGIYNSVPSGANDNYGYYQDGTFIGAGDVGMILNNTFATTNNAVISQLRVNPIFNTTIGSIEHGHAIYVTPSFVIDVANQIQSAYGINIELTNTINAAEIFYDSYGIKVWTWVNGSDSTPLHNSYNLYLNGTYVSGSAVVNTSYGIYNTGSTFAQTNYGYYQLNAFTKTNDIGMQIADSFVPSTGGGTFYDLIVSSSFRTLWGTIVAAYAASITPNFGNFTPYFSQIGFKKL
jgi:hypothetical protein